MHKKFGLLSPSREASSHSAALPSFFVFVVLCAVFSCFHNTGCGVYSFTTDEYGIFNVHTNVGACHTHKGGSGTNKSAHELTRRDRKSVPHPAPPGDQTQGTHMYTHTKGHTHMHTHKNDTHMHTLKRTYS